MFTEVNTVGTFFPLYDAKAFRIPTYDSLPLGSSNVIYHNLCSIDSINIFLFILAPAFEGRKEIWDALRGACYAIEQNDTNLAQSSKSNHFFSIIFFCY
jgi:hypothetical protein